jgi:hypothetical protein
MESEQSQDFNERLSQWVANQGFWFQVRYSMSGSGSAGTAMFHLLKLSFRLLIFALILAVGGAVYLMKRTGTKSFRKDFTASLQDGLAATRIEVGSLSRDQGQLNISRIDCVGSPDTFYSRLEAKTIHGKMNFIDGVIGQWDLGVISIFKLDIDLNAGADDAESSHNVGKALFKESDRVRLNSLNVADATLRWGYSERTFGSIENSEMKVQRLPQSMKVSFKGGTFSQNWLKNMEIIDMVVDCTPNGFTVERAEFRQGPAMVDFSGLSVIGGERPLLKGVAKIRRLPLENVLPTAMRSFVEGSISGDFQVSGSTNTVEGVIFSGRVVLDGQDTLTLRERLPILKALSDVDYVRNYYRVNFQDGSFQMKTSSGQLTISELKLESDDLLTMEGEMHVRLPTPEESRSSVMKGEVSKAAMAPRDDAAEEQKTASKKQANTFSLSRAAKETKREKNADTTTSAASVAERLSDAMAARQLAEQAADRAAKTLRYEGKFLITLPADAFELAPKLLAKFPVDPTRGRIPLVIPLEGDLYDLTARQADEIYQLRSH